MNKIIPILLVLNIILFTSCSKQEEQELVHPADQLKVFVDSIEKIESTDEELWKIIQEEYKLKVSKAEVLAISEDEKSLIKESRKSFEKVLLRKDIVSPSFVTTTNTNFTLKDNNSRKESIKEQLFHDTLGINSKDFSWINSNNGEKTFTFFVNAVRDHKESYTVMDWKEVTKIYNDLNSQILKIEKNLSSEQKLAIARRRLEFSSYTPAL